MGLVTVFILALTLVSVGLSGYALSRDVPLNWRFVVDDVQVDPSTASFEQVFDYTAQTGQAHSPAIMLNEHGFRILWFEGSAEAQSDVDVWGVQLTAEPAGWRTGERHRVISRADLGSGFEPRQLVVTLGNTIEHEGEHNHAFATVVSVGGWAMASVADVTLGGVPQSARKLNLSPFLNRSHLVKSPMVRFADGSWGLPAYFEMGATYGTLVRFSPDGRVRDQARMTGRGHKPIQPMIVPLSETRAVAFLRDFDPSGGLLVSRTEDGGQTWTRVESTQIPNPSAPVAALRLANGRILMAMNDDAAGADRLRLAVSSDDGTTWRSIKTLEDDGGDARYPMLRRLASGEIALAYSHGTKRGIRAFVFNDAWVDAQ